MSEPEPRVEHHYHDPTTGQVYKAVRQYLTDKLPADYLDKQIDDKIREAIDRKIAFYLKGEAFDRLICNAVAQAVRGETQPFENNKYGIAKHMRDLIVTELSRLLVSGYEVKVEKR